MSTRQRHLLTSIILIIMASISAFPAANAAGKRDTTAERLMGELRKKFNSDNRDALYAVADEYRRHSLRTGNMADFYMVWKAEIMYDINFNHFYQAMKKTLDMSGDMKKRECTDELYNATFLIGVIYSLQGNNELAKTYLRKSLEEIGTGDSARAIQIYKDLANVEMDENPQEAMADLDHAIRLIKRAGLKYEYSDAIGFKVIVAFVMRDWKSVKASYNHYMRLKNEYGNEFSTTYYDYVQMCKHTADGDYGKAVEWADRLTNIDRHKFRTMIYEIAGDSAAAYMAQKEYMRMKDSLNSCIMVDELSSATKEIEMISTKVKAEEAKTMKTALILTVVIAIIIIAALVLIIKNRDEYLKNLRQKNNELEIMRRKAEEAARMKASFLKNMSHEVRTPLNIISGFAQIISGPDPGLSAEEKRDIVKRVTKSSNDIVRIISDLLYISSQESTDEISRDDKVSCNELCRKAVNRISDTAAKDVSVVFHSNISDDFTVRTSERSITRILDNLLDNAVKFTQSGSINVKCDISENGKSVVISVTDTGCGIEKDEKDRIFDLFYKTDDNLDGLGLGLPLTRRMARIMGGDIAIDHNYTDGARFILTLPVD